MNPLRSILTLLAGASLLGASAGAQDEAALLIEKLERENRQLQLELLNLQDSYQAALEREETKTKSLAEIKKQLALFGKEFFEGGDDRLRHAVADYQVSRENLETLQSASLSLINTTQNYLRTAIASDPDLRADVESRIREVETALGYREKPARKVERGTPQASRIVSIDQETGVAIINAGTDSKVATGMRFRIDRGGLKLAEATVATTRENVSGLFLNQFNDLNNPVRPGDTASVIIETPQP